MPFSIPDYHYTSFTVKDNNFLIILHKKFKKICFVIFHKFRVAVSDTDGDRRRVYILQAQELEALRRKVLAVSQTEKPYDIFICYKESDQSGRRTKDSILAAKLYRSLTADGYRVFFSRVTLEDKIGSEYEPYIFAAVNSAKIMFAVGTSPENFNSPWVKNEWSRYLTRISESGDGTLAVLYSDMRQKDLPVEFAHLQSFDMSAPDFTEELLRGIHKIMLPELNAESYPFGGAVPEENASGLLRRAEILLEEGEFSFADELCENALNLEPENANIYFVKLLAGFGLKTAKELSGLAGDLEQSQNYRMIMRFGDDEMKLELSEYRKAALYNKYQKDLERADSEELCLAAAEYFKSLNGFRDSGEKAREAIEKSERIKAEENERDYAKAKNLIAEGSMSALSSALNLLLGLVKYKDSAELCEKVKENISALDNAHRQSELEQAEHEKHLQEKRRKIKKRALRILAISLSAAAVAVISNVFIYNITFSSKYQNAVSLRDTGDFDGAAEAFLELNGYSDSEFQVTDTRYQKACSLYEQKNYADSEQEFSALGNYKDSAEYVLKNQYALACEAFEDKDFDNAQSLFETLGSYSDSADKLNEVKYQKAENLYNSKKFGEAAETFRALGKYSDSKERVLECQYNSAVSFFNNKNYDEAYNGFLELGNYLDSSERAIESEYYLADLLLSNGEFEKSETIFTELGAYKDSPNRIQEVKFRHAGQCADNGDYHAAVKILEETDYPGSAELLKESRYNYGVQLLKDKDFGPARYEFSELEGYKDSAEKYNEAQYGIACEYLERDLFDAAEEMFLELGNFSDSAEKLAEMDHLRFVRAKAGDILKFGRCRQSRAYKEPEDIEWIVVKREGTRVMVISRMVLDTRAYGGETWAESTLRAYLNGEFFNSVFSNAEQTMIPLVKLENPDDEVFGGKGGEDTEDRVFLMSYEDAETLTESGRLAELTVYAKDEYLKKLPVLPEGQYWGLMHYKNWWLRDPKKPYTHKAVSGIGGSFHLDALEFTDDTVGVRPVIWIEMGE